VASGRCTIVYWSDASRPRKGPRPGSSSPTRRRRSRSKARYWQSVGARDETGRVVPLDVKVGDGVLFGKWAGTGVLIDGEERLILKESDILGVLEGKTRAKAKAA